MKAEAEANAAADKAEREKVDKLNQADSMIFTTENFLKDNADKVPAEDKPAIEAAIQKLKDAHKAQDIAAIDAATAELNNVMQAASQKMYAAGAQAGPQAGPDMGGAGFNGGAGAGAQGGQNASGSSSAQQGAEDADFEEVR